VDTVDKKDRVHVRIRSLVVYVLALVLAALGPIQYDLENQRDLGLH
jgi:hypothetical protein